MTLFADDIMLYRPIYTPADYSRLQQDNDDICTWTTNNLLKFNYNKCKYMVISRKRSYCGGWKIMRDWTCTSTRSLHPGIRSSVGRYSLCSTTLWVLMKTAIIRGVSLPWLNSHSCKPHLNLYTNEGVESPYVLSYTFCKYACSQ